MFCRGKSGNKAASSFPGGLWMLCRIVCWFNAHSGGSVLLAWRRENHKEQAVPLETGICGIQQLLACLDYVHESAALTPSKIGNEGFRVLKMIMTFVLRVLDYWCWIVWLLLTFMSET